MQKSNKLQHKHNKAEIVTNDKKLEQEKHNTAIFNQQNNFNLSQNIDIGKLTQLSVKNPELAQRVMDLYERQQQHNMNIDNKILTIEEKEQEARISNIPFQRKFIFRTLNFAVALSLISLCSAGIFAYLGHIKLAIISIVIPIIITVANILKK